AMHGFGDQNAAISIETNGTLGNAVLVVRNNDTTLNSGAIRSVNFDQSDGDAWSQIGDHNGSATGKSFLTFKTSASERLRIDETGQVGIGSQSPAALLDVAG